MSEQPEEIDPKLRNLMAIEAAFTKTFSSLLAVVWHLEREVTDLRRIVDGE